MATLIPSIGTSAFDSTGERRLAKRLEQKLDAHYIPLRKPSSSGREGLAPFIAELPTRRDEVFPKINQLASAQKESFACSDMAALCANWKTRGLIASIRAQHELLHAMRNKRGEYQPGEDANQVMKFRKGLVFPLVTLPGEEHMPAGGKQEREAARGFYVSATRATQWFVFRNG